MLRKPNNNLEHLSEIASDFDNRNNEEVATYYLIISMMYIL